jgi:hypothetical protein
MAGRRAQRPRSVERVTEIAVDDPQTDRAIAAVRTAVERLEEARQYDVLTVDLVVGSNKVRHGLGRPVVGYTITPTVADASFAHAIDRDNPRPQAEVWIDIVGVDQPAATLEVY